MIPTDPTLFGFNANTVEQFDSVYWLSQPPSVQALQTANASQRNALAMGLAGQGFFIDVPIMVWGWDPYMVMFQRQGDGYTTYPDALNAQTRKVSLNLSDYPPYPVNSAPSSGELIGSIIGFGPFFYPTTLATKSNIPSGFVQNENGHSYTAVYIQQQSPIPGAGSQMILRWLQTS
jgi:hypothetical protein